MNGNTQLAAAIETNNLTMPSKTVNLSLVNTPFTFEQALQAWVDCASSTEKVQEAQQRILNCYYAALNNIDDLNGQILDLHNLSLKSVPDCLGELSNLTCIYLDHNELTSLPASLCKLPLLEELYANHNQLTSLPDELGNVITLQGIDVSDNKLTSIPVSIQNLPNVWVLYFYNNPLEDVLKA